MQMSRRKGKPTRMVCNQWKENKIKRSLREKCHPLPAFYNHLYVSDTSGKVAFQSFFRLLIDYLCLKNSLIALNKPYFCHLHLYPWNYAANHKDYTEQQKGQKWICPQKVQKCRCSKCYRELKKYLVSLIVLSNVTLAWEGFTGKISETAMHKKGSHSSMHTKKVLPTYFLSFFLVWPSDDIVTQIQMGDLLPRNPYLLDSPESWPSRNRRWVSWKLQASHISRINLPRHTDTKSIRKERNMRN